MKRNILALGLFSLCCAALCVGPAHALFDGFRCWRCPRYVTQITCRPYNAFTPICWGNLICDGCCPSPCGVASGCLPMTLGAPPWCCNYGGPGMGGPCMGGGCMGGPGMDGPMMGGCCGPDACCASDMPMAGGPGMPMMSGMMPGGPGGMMPGGMMPMPGMPGGMPMPDIRNQPPFTAPMPAPVPAPGTAMGGYPQMPNGIAQASWNQGYYPTPYPYYPGYPMPYPYQPYPYPYSPVPSYWYGAAR